MVKGKSVGGRDGYSVNEMFDDDGNFIGYGLYDPDGNYLGNYNSVSEAESEIPLQLKP